MGEGRSEVERRKQLEPASCSPSSRESSRSPSWARLAAGVFALAVVAGVFAVGLAARAAAASSSKRHGASGDASSSNDAARRDRWARAAATGAWPSSWMMQATPATTTQAIAATCASPCPPAARRNACEAFSGGKATNPHFYGIGTQTRSECSLVRFIGGGKQDELQRLRPAKTGLGVMGGPSRPQPPSQTLERLWNELITSHSECSSS